MDTILEQKSTFELIIKLIDALIWPVTLLCILLIFRRHLSEVILRLGTLKADKTGIELSFDKKIEATKQMFKQIQPSSIAKSGGDIRVFPEEDRSPYGRIQKVRTQLVNSLMRISDNSKIQMEGLRPESLAEVLKRKGAISPEKAQMVSAMLEVTASATATATEKQAEEVENLMKRISIN